MSGVESAEAGAAATSCVSEVEEARAARNIELDETRMVYKMICVVEGNTKCTVPDRDGGCKERKVEYGWPVQRGIYTFPELTYGC